MNSPQSHVCTFFKWLIYADGHSRSDKKIRFVSIIILLLNDLLQFMSLHLQNVQALNLFIICQKKLSSIKLPLLVRLNRHLFNITLKPERRLNYLNVSLNELLFSYQLPVFKHIFSRGEFKLILPHIKLLCRVYFLFDHVSRVKNALLKLKDLLPLLFSNRIIWDDLVR